MSRATLVAAFALSMIVSAASGPFVTAARADVAAELQYIIQDGIVPPGAEDDDDRLLQLFVYYEERSFKGVFVRDNGPKTKARVLLSILKDAAGDGLEPGDYPVAEIDARLADGSAAALAEAEILLALAMLDFGRDLGIGRVDPRDLESDTRVVPKGPGPMGLLDGAEQADDMAVYVASLAPQSENYRRLKQTLADYRVMAQQGPWPQIAAGPTLKPGARDPRVATLRERLRRSGELAEGAHDGDVYDGALVDAVRRFQELHGLEIDGAVGPDTLGQLNVPLAQRIVSLKLNLERRRWMADDLGARHIFVNLADQFLKVVDNGRTIHTALTVVGKPYHQSPVFSEQMRYLVFHPYWNVPPSIARNEYLPKLRRDPGVLQAENVRVLSGSTVINPYAVDWTRISGRFPFRLRQDPGANNALGRIKFMFPNDFNVYIHDTPAKSLFSRATRAFSHGCIRVQHPEQLAAVLLAAQGWSAGDVERALQREKRRIVRLEKPIPVHITYLTAWANKDGSVHFRKDIYGRDARLTEALGRRR